MAVRNPNALYELVFSFKKVRMSRNIGGYLVELLVANDIDTVFGIPGVHNLELYRGLTATSMRHVLVRHEQGAGFAADGFARLSGRPAAAFVISGPGLTNIMTAAAQAYSDSVPLLVIASAPVRASFGKQWGVLHELYDQAAVAAGVFGIARSARSAEDVRDHLRLCLASLRTGRPRPAYLEIPLDVLAETTTLEAQRFEGTALLPQASPDQIDAAVRLLAVAERPLIIAGGGARRAGAQLHRLVDTLDCPLVTTAAGKGVLPESHPANFGTSLPYRPIQQLISDADVVLAVGTELGETDIYFTTKLPLSGQLIRIDVDPSVDESPARRGFSRRMAYHSRRSREISRRNRQQFGFKGTRPGKRAARHQGRVALGRCRFQRHDANRLFRKLRLSRREPRTMVPSFRLRHPGICASGSARRQDFEPCTRRHCSCGRFRIAVHCRRTHDRGRSRPEFADRGVEQLGIGPNSRRHDRRRHSATGCGWTKPRLRRTRACLRRGGLSSA
jgi:hypothetical protein